MKTKLRGKISSDIIIASSYLMAIFIGYLIGLEQIGRSEVLSLVKEFIELTVPLLALYIAFEGLNSWKKAERTKVVSSLAQEILKDFKPRFEVETNHWKVNIDFLIRKRNNLSVTGKLTEDRYRDYHVKVLNGLHEFQKRLHRLDSEVFEKHYHYILIINGELYTKHKQFQQLLPIWSLDNMLLEQRNHPDSNFDVTEEYSDKLLESLVSLYRQLLEHAGATSS
ncbi:hypothetical protein L1D50_18790 [Pseudoalteromonas sp. Isolate6]|uniref:hypothetical protein n=1 Tax=Pseudoalteromonas sp. Isolate6 TaxID=2908527 RepID=UPI001EFE5E6C|nr:hypothetical protein [Pseudoalteromonas sp. Isolate6]MCG9761150.1 hypothetical protein [Pseudoalteromonas sp. Isolate6]